MTDVKQYWEQLYGEKEQAWSGKVNAGLAARVADLPPGRALDLGCGEGGDALWLAERGWAVTAVDISDTALRRARAAAGRRGLEVDWRQVDLADDLPGGPYDLVSAQFFQSKVELPRVQVLRRAAVEVAAGGLLLVVGHAAPPAWSDHPVDPVLMPSAETVWADLALGQDWEALEVADVLRSATHGGRPVELLDSVVMARRT